ncbi:hypothetical protein AAFP30_05595 [Gordonia sp. CPCC 205515]|uniref:hypothetical protein n=1 Tax=Gordonia sp. CPCC 205515 TaxID=3140791 RepID=UPI003AF349CC
MSIRVDPQIYYNGAKKLTDIGSGIESARSTLSSSLSDTGSMSGTSDAAKKWATSYDKRADNAIQAAYDLSGTLTYFGGLMALAGYNHELANYRADSGGNKGPEPTKPSSVRPPAGLCLVGVPSSGGPGNGLVSGIGALMEKIHIHVPDGDTDKLGNASSAWKDFFGSEAVAHAASDISGVVNSLGEVDAPDVLDIMTHLDTLKQAAKGLYKSTNQLAADCANHKAPLDTLRTKIDDALTTLEEAIAVSLAISILADVVTAGVGVVLDGITLAKSARDVDEAASTITAAVEAAQIDRLLSTAAAEEDVLANTSTELANINELTATDLEEGLEEATSVPKSAPGGQAPTPQEAQDVITTAERTGKGLKNDPMHRSAAYPVDDIGTKGTVFQIDSRSGIPETLVQMPGEVNGVPGRFEWIVDKNGYISHEMFVRNGTINGVPIKP